MVIACPALNAALTVSWSLGKNTAVFFDGKTLHFIDLHTRHVVFDSYVAMLNSQRYEHVHRFSWYTNATVYIFF